MEGLDRTVAKLSGMLEQSATYVAGVCDGGAQGFGLRFQSFKVSRFQKVMGYKFGVVSCKL
jgi:hypothetical protein